jgi:DNA-directed RNA polymerase subunit alpha
MKWKNLQMPKKIEIDKGVSNEHYGRFAIEPLERGFGITIGNALRRVLLSSLQGAAVSSVRIDGVLHEFSTVPGVLEDVTEIVLNLKQIRFKLHADHSKKARFVVNGPAEVLAGDLERDADLDVLNPELHVCTVNKEGALNMEVEVTAGRGYMTADMLPEEDRPIGVIPIDAHFSPVRKCNFFVENTRIGQRVDFDKLTLEVWTDGSILPQDAVAWSAKILQDHFAMFVQFEEEISTDVEVEEDAEKQRIKDLLMKSVEEMELSVRSANCLRAADIKTIGDLVQKPESMMLKYRNFGRKSLKEISDILSEMGLAFGMDVTPYLGKGAVHVPTMPPPELLKTDFEDDDDDDMDDDMDLDDDSDMDEEEDDDLDLGEGADKDEDVVANRISDSDSDSDHDEDGKAEDDNEER